MKEVDDAKYSLLMKKFETEYKMNLVMNEKMSKIYLSN